MTDFSKKIDLHMHTRISDGTDTPEELVEKIRSLGISVFSVTDHDSVKGCGMVRKILKEGDPVFIPGVEFSCKDEEGKYHILGYGYDDQSDSIKDMVRRVHMIRMDKVFSRLELLKEEFGFDFPEEEIDKLLARENPGKPHIGNLMVKLGYANSKEEAIKDYIDKLHYKSEYIRPETAIAAIIEAGGIPILAHPSYGSGDQLIVGEEMESRLKKLIGFGIKGVEAFYSGFTSKLRAELLDYAKKYDLYTTAGSDYHGKNKLVVLGDTGLNSIEEAPESLKRFLKELNVY